MAIFVEMPKMSDTMEEGVLVTWLVEEGDAVSAGDIIAQVETDKATMDLEVYDDGVLLKKVIPEGAAVPIGGLIAVLGKEGEDISDLLATAGGGVESAVAACEGKSTAGGGAGPIAPADEGKSTAPPLASGGGREEPAGDGSMPPARPVSGEMARGGSDGRVKSSPLARRLAGEHGVALHRIEGSGPDGRIVKRDVEAAIQRSTRPVEVEPAYRMPLALLEVSEGGEPFESERISSMRRVIARRLAASKFTAPHFYLVVDVDVDRAVDARARLNERIEAEGGVRISPNDLVTKACALALRRHPIVNASYLEEEQEIRRHREVHVAVAVAIGEGLVTPVIRHADRKGLASIAAETRELAQKARDRTLRKEEMEGSTFTTSNLGMYGIEEFTAIINPPNSCILAIGAIRDAAVVRQGQVVPGKRMKLTLSCDHRIVDGAVGAEFLATVRGYLEEPLSMLM